MEYESLTNEFQRLQQADEIVFHKAETRMDTLIRESHRVADVAHNAEQVLHELNDQFSKQTGLTKPDIVILLIAVGLQIARQCLLTKFPQRMDDQTAAKATHGHIEEHSNRQHRYYAPSLNEIITNPVPFDAFDNSNGALRGGGKMGHRVTAIGHDPLLGLIFGTANIATATLTTNDFRSFHIGTNTSGRDFFKCNARTDLVLSRTGEKLMHSGSSGKRIVGASLLKEIIHLKTDLNTKHSLPLPGLTMCPNLANELVSYGLDMANVVTIGKQVTFAALINTLVAMFHRALFDGNDRMEKKLYEVRTRKILCYSNLIASSANLVGVAFTNNVAMLDLGGIAVAIYRLISDMKFIRQVKYEFVFGSFHQMIQGEDLELPPYDYSDILASI